MSSPTWQTDWPFRVYERLSERGFHSLSEFVDSHPLASLLHLARELGPGVAAVQLEWLWVREAEDRGQIGHMLSSLLVRRIRHAIPAGWSIGDEFDFQLASGIASWRCVADEALPQSEQMRLWEFIRDLAPEPGWLPTVPPDDITTQILHELEQALLRARQTACGVE